MIDRVNAALQLSHARFQERRAREAREARLALLTPQEAKIAGWVVEGKSSREIAELAGISARTVENHRARIMDKLRVSSIAELVRALI